MVPLSRPWNTLYDYATAVLRLLTSRAFHAGLARAVNERFDVVHFNHSGLFPLAAWLRRRTGAAFTMHYRKLFPDTRFARFQVRSICRDISRLVFITENERRNFEELDGNALGSVIYNIVEKPSPNIVPHPDIPNDGRFKVASLSNFALTRGTDRMIDVATALGASARDRFLFVMAGDMRLSRSFPGLLGRIARDGGTLADYAAERGVGDMFLFMGHVSEPERVLAACDVLVKPTRIDIPWGRDVLEAMAFAMPVVTCGTWDRFIRHNETGFLHAGFDPADFGRDLQMLAGDAALCGALGAAARARVLELCNGPDRAADLEAVWREVAV